MDGDRNLDREIEELREVALDEQSLDQVDDVSDEYDNMISEVVREADRIRESVSNKRTSRVKEHRSRTKLEKLLEPDGIEFIRNAYLRVLGRKADSNGEEILFSKLVSSEMEKEEILYYLATCEEGQKRGVRIAGLEQAYRRVRIRKKLFRIPVAGRISNYVYGLSKINRRHNKLEYRFNILEKADRDQIHNTIDLYGENLRNNNVLLKKHDDLLEQPFRELQKEVELLASGLATVKSQMANMTFRGAVEGKTGNQEKTKSEISAAPSGSLQESVDSTYDSIDYFDFENHFRGSREHIKEVQEIYLPYFEGRKHVLDLGCGRGEFTELLLEHEVGVTGVDMYSPYVEYMKMRSLPAVCDDAIHYLENCDECDGIFLGQVVEHISVEQIIRLCRLAHEKLVPGSYLIMETPNPMCLAIYTESFYMDPSHNKPVHPRTLQYLTQKAGFESAEILFTESSRRPYQIPSLPENSDVYREFNTAMKQVSEVMFGSQDYAVIARK